MAEAFWYRVVPFRPPCSRPCVGSARVEERGRLPASLAIAVGAELSNPPASDGDSAPLWRRVSVAEGTAGA